MRISTYLVVAACFAASSAYADTIHVYEGDSIQIAIDNCVNGDEIIVHPGTYNESLDLLGKGIALRSSDGPDVTIISGANLTGSVVTCASGEGPDTIIEGLSVQDGVGGTQTDSNGCGGGMYIDGSDPTIISCNFVNNLADGEVHGLGGGVYLSSSSSTFTDCQFLNNVVHADWFQEFAQGGGVYSEFGNVTFSNCRFAGNALDHALDTDGLEGAGLYCENGWVTVEDCVFFENRCEVPRRGFGGGIYITGDAKLNATGCTFDANKTIWAGGIYLADTATSSIVDCTFQNTRIQGAGSGILLDEAGHATVDRCSFVDSRAYEGAFNSGRSSFTITNSNFERLNAGYDAAAICAWESTGTIDGCVFSECHSGELGGAIYTYQFNGDIVNSTFKDCSTDYWGGAIYIHPSNVNFANCLFVRNVADWYGGAVEVDQATVTMTNCTFTKNDAGIGGYAMLLYAATTKISNSIFWDNYLKGGVRQQGGWLSITYCDVQTGRDGEGNFDAPPMFADPANDDYRLRPGSPCIDAGRNDQFWPIDDLDMDGNPRFVDSPYMTDTGRGDAPLIDIGAYEFQAASGPALTVDPMPLVAGQPGIFEVHDACGERETYLVYSLKGTGKQIIPLLNVTLDLRSPKQAGKAKTADADGFVMWKLPVPQSAAGRDLWFQAAQMNLKTDVVQTSVE